MTVVITRPIHRMSTKPADLPGKHLDNQFRYSPPTLSHYWVCTTPPQVRLIPAAQSLGRTIFTTASVYPFACGRLRVCSRCYNRMHDRPSWNALRRISSSPFRENWSSLGAESGTFLADLVTRVNYEALDSYPFLAGSPASDLENIESTQYHYFRRGRLVAAPQPSGANRHRSPAACPLHPRPTKETVRCHLCHSRGVCIASADGH